MSEDTFDLLVGRVRLVTKLGARDASIVAINLQDAHGDDPTPAQIVRMTRKLGHKVDADPLTLGLRELQLEPDPAEVLKQVYLTTPRVLNTQVPVIGRAPKDSVFFRGLGDQAEFARQLEHIPEDVRVLIGSIDLFESSLTFHLYDEANDLDRAIGPIDLERFESGQEMHGAIELLLKRLPRVLSADFN